MRRVLALLLVLLAIGVTGAVISWPVIKPRTAEGPDPRKGSHVPDTPWRARDPEKSAAAPGPAATPPAPEKDVGPEPVVMLLGRVLDRALRPIAGAELDLEVAGEDAVRIRTDGEGAFRLDALPARAHVRLSTGDDRAGGPIPRRFQLPPSLIVARLNWVWGRTPGGRVRPGGVLAVELGDRLALFVEGDADLPVGAQLAVAFRYGDNTHFRIQTPVAEGRFDGELRPPDGGFFSGTYRLVFDFHPLEQPRAVIEALPPALADGATASLRVYVGDPEDEARYEVDCRRYYTDLLRELRPFVDELVLATGLALGEFKEEALRGEQLTRLRALSGGDPVPGGRFDQAAWRTWMDERMRPQIAGPLSRHAKRGRPKYPEPENLVGFVLRECDRLTRIASIRAYKHNKKPTAEADYYVEEFGPDPDQRVALERIAEARRGVIKWLRVNRS